MSTLTAKELSLQHPKRFQQEYSKWAEYAVDYDWWDWTEERLRETLAPAGVRVDKLWFRLSYSQGDYATFEGHIMVWEWMEATKDGDQTYAEKYPALRLALADYGEDATVTTYNRSCGARVNLEGNVVGNTYPTGIFAGLEQEAWDELVLEQFESEDWDRLATYWLREKCDDLYRRLREEHEYLTSEEQFIEHGEECEV